MASRRGAVKVNPVTGELTRIDATKEEGTVRSGCVSIPERYLHAARDAGLAQGTEMFGHVKSLKRVGAADGNSGTRAVAEKRKAGFGAGGPNIKQVVQGRTRSVTATAAKGGKPDCAFEKRKGVVNGLGGAKDLTRKTGTQAAGVQRGAGNIVGFAGPVEARAPTKRFFRREPAAASLSSKADKFSAPELAKRAAANTTKAAGKAARPKPASSTPGAVTGAKKAPAGAASAAAKKAPAGAASAAAKKAPAGAASAAAKKAPAGAASAAAKKAPAGAGVGGAASHAGFFRREPAAASLSSKHNKFGASAASAGAPAPKTSKGTAAPRAAPAQGLGRRAGGPGSPEKLPVAKGLGRRAGAPQ
ncbi:hypothetical protein FNF27_08142 [Cafeteria roenbergensis]|uniref:Uncharacterized protein n=1 Tax=Cafeteria roenbergensis TaxID=33653 RepID=A0A5A8D8Y0_CAFRO|nr:hypothetical protein FNF27_08142 [Cafeteria roenbergensis]